MANGSWDSITDYTDCSKVLREEDSADISLIIYAGGNFGYRVYSCNS